MTAGRIVRPVDAAGLILLRGKRDAPEILLGRRHSKTAFLPDIYVVPGGRVDPCDHLPSGFRERLHPAVAKALGNGRRPPVAFLRAALRELHEETGLMLAGGGSGKPGSAAVWQAYGQAGGAPDFGALDFVLRAITPVGSHRRYNTRFFLGDGGTAIGDHPKQRRAARSALVEAGGAGPAQHRRCDLGADPPCAGALAGPRSGWGRTG